MISERIAATAGRCPRGAFGLALALSLGAIVAGPARAGYTNPNSTTFLSTYAGAKAPDLEVGYVDVLYNAARNDFVFTATMNGAIGTTPGALYVFGIDRGMGTARFAAGNPSIGANILFDSVLILTAAGTGQFNDFVNPANSTAITSGITIGGNTITADVSAGLIPTTGFALGQYTYNLWPRLGTGSNTQIAQFVPDGVNLNVSVPEPASAVLVAGGLLVVGARARRTGRLRRSACEDRRVLANLGKSR